MIKRKLARVVALTIIGCTLSGLMTGCSGGSKYVHKALPTLDTAIRNEIDSVNRSIDSLSNAVRGNSTAEAKAEEQRQAVIGKLTRFKKSYADTNTEDADIAIQELFNNLSYVATNFECASYIAGDLAKKLMDNAFSANGLGYAINTNQDSGGDIEYIYTDKNNHEKVVDRDVYYYTYNSSDTNNYDPYSDIRQKSLDAISGNPIVTYLYGKQITVQIAVKDLAVNGKTKCEDIFGSGTPLYIRTSDSCPGASGSWCNYNYNGCPDLAFKPILVLQNEDGTKYEADGPLTSIGVGSYVKYSTNYTDNNYYCNEVRDILKTKSVRLKDGMDFDYLISGVDTNGYVKTDGNPTISELIRGYNSWLQESRMNKFYQADAEYEQSTLRGLRNAAKAIYDECHDLSTGIEAFDYSDNDGAVLAYATAGTDEGTRMQYLTREYLQKGASMNLSDRLEYENKLSQEGYNASSYTFMSYIRCGRDMGLSGKIKMLGIKVIIEDSDFLPSGATSQTLNVNSSATPFDIVDPEFNTFIGSMLTGKIYALSNEKVKNVSLPVVMDKIQNTSTVGSFASYFEEVRRATSSTSSNLKLGSGGYDISQAASGNFVETKDIVVTENNIFTGRNEPVAIVCMNSLSDTAFTNLVSTLSGSGSRFIYGVNGVTESSSGTALVDGATCYLAQYPVLSISEFVGNYKDDKWQAQYESGSNYNSQLSSYTQTTNSKNYTNMELNLITDSVYIGGLQRDVPYDEFTNTQLYSFGKTENTCSFAFGKDGSAVAYKGLIELNGNSTRILGGLPPIVLTDYLEGVYLPGTGVNEKDKFTCFGRRIRVKNFNGSLSDSAVVGRYLNRDGTENTTIKQLTIGEVISASSDSDVKPASIMSSFNYYKTGSVYKPYRGSSADYTCSGQYNKVAEFATGSNLENLNGYKVKLQLKGDKGYEISNATASLDALSGMVGDSSTLKTVLAERVATGHFADGTLSTSQTLSSNASQCVAGSVDIGNQQKIGANLFVLCTDKNLSDSELMTSWVNSENQDSGNVDWWNTWLGENFYEYRVDMNEIEDQLVSLYRFTNESIGYIVLDLDTIANIQTLMDQRATTKEAQWYRTIGFIIGILLIFYAILLLAAWALDINIAGFHMLRKMTLGKWEAVQDKDNMSDEDEAGIRFIGLKDVLVGFLVIGCIGYIIATLDPVQLIGDLINVFGGIIEYIRENIFGNLGS